MDARSWMPALGTDLDEWLYVGFAIPVHPWRWRVYASSLPAALLAIAVGQRYVVPKHGMLGLLKGGFASMVLP